MLVPIVIALLLSGCSHSSQVARAEKQFFNAYAESLSEHKGYYFVRPFESGKGTIQTLGARLTIEKEVEFDAARTLIVAEAHRFLSMANRDKGMIPYIKPYPMTLDRVNMTIVFLSENGEYAPTPYVAQCELSDNAITFSKREPYNNELSPDTFREKLTVGER